MLILLGDGIDSWTTINRRSFERGHYSDDPKLGRRMMEALIRHQKVYYCTQLKDGHRLGVVKCPEKVTKKTEVKEWLEWFANLLEGWTGGKLRIIYSPSEKYDSIVKTATIAAGIDGILVNPDVRGTPRYAECNEVLQRLAAYRADQEKKRELDLEESDMSEPPTQRASRDPSPLRKPTSEDLIDLTKDDDEEDQEQPGPSRNRQGPSKLSRQGVEGRTFAFDFDEGQWAEAAKEWSPRRDWRGEFQPQAYSMERKPAAPLRQRSGSSSDDERGDTDEERGTTDSPRKKPQKSSARKMPRELAPLPKEIISIKMQTGLQVHRYIGEPWDIEGDGLIAFTNDKYKIHNRQFRVDLKHRAGEDYQRDQRLLRTTGSAATKGEVVVINGYNLNYGVVVLVPIDAYKKGDNLEDYRKKIWHGLYRGLTAASNEGMRRVVVSVQGLRSPELRGNTAQSVAEKGVVSIAKTNSHLLGLNEVVLVVDPRLHQLQTEQGVRAAAEIEEQYHAERSPPETNIHPLGIQGSDPPNGGQTGRAKMVKPIKIKLKTSSIEPEGQAPEYVRRLIIESDNHRQRKHDGDQQEKEPQVGAGDGLMRPAKMQPLNTLKEEPIRQPQYSDISE
ncbi:uncharacterized protein LOC106937924 [Poecilia latipinna]|uniref:uncharacterized protein LOC106937924 n=1 Tax=Poecilia latipinna TaxID=48699 RepID=UPI00072DE483|nr:PREDICTED: uncharacterized protein LOC106937924 [Poecilia latipinna]